MIGYQMILSMLWLWLFLSTALQVVNATLTIHPLGSYTCADGSPFGIYVEDYDKKSFSFPQNHVLVFMGGGSCTSPEDCTKDYHARPYVFSSHYNPQTIQGDTILSRDPKINPTMHNYTKWMIPYCSQDFFLGNGVEKGKVGNFTHYGSVLFEQALSFWKEQVLIGLNKKGQASAPVLENVVAVGISAGAVALMNHIPLVRQAANEIDTQNLLIVLDAPSVVSDNQYLGKDFNKAMELYVDLEAYPLCDPSNYYSRLYDSVSALPCCLSTHCLMRHDTEGLASFVLPPSTEGDNNKTAIERLLILDSAYDPVALIGGTMFLQDGKSPLEESDRTASNDSWNVVESAGRRKARTRETTAAVKALRDSHVSLLVEQNKREQPQVLKNTSHSTPPRATWIYTSCVSHAFLAPSVEFLYLACNYANYQLDDFVKVVCNDRGQATEYSSDWNVKMRIWRTIDIWIQVKFEGQSIREILNDFIINSAIKNELPSTGQPPAIDVRFQTCSGPNCLCQAEDDEKPACQALIEIVDASSPVPVAFQVTWMIFFGALIFLSLALRSSPTPADQPSASQSLHSTSNDIKPPNQTDPPKNEHLISGWIFSIEGIHVSTKDGTTVLRDADVELQGGTITGITGRSGSGKSTLLKVLSQNCQQNFIVSMRLKSKSQLQAMTKAFLCQEDQVVAFGNLCPAEYLLITANIYNASLKQIEDLYLLTKELFSRGDTKEQAIKYQKKRKELDPFYTTKIFNLSGGQRRILSIAATLLRNPSLLLLDEPLSGLDTISCSHVMSALAVLAMRHQCAVFVTVHQPSEAILANFHRLVVLDSGRIVFNQRIAQIGTKKALKLIDKYLLYSHEAGRSSFLRSSHRSSFFLTNVPVLSGQPFSSSIGTGTSGPSEALAITESLEDEAFPYPVDSQASEDASFEAAKIMATGDPKKVEDNCSAVLKAESSLLDQRQSCHEHNWRTVAQTKPLAQRIQSQRGYVYVDSCVVILVLCIAAAVLRVEETLSPRQIIMASASMIAMPAFLFTPMIFDYNSLWISHKFELDDRRISPLSFQIATSLFNYPAPLVTLFIGVALEYAILEWEYQTYLVQSIFAAVHLLVAFQFGRVLSVLFWGNFGRVTKAYTTVLLYCAVFSSVLVPSHKFPDSLQFLFRLSINFWAISGTVLNQFNADNYSNVGKCYDFFTCFFTDGAVVGQAMGFSPLSHSYRALGVLSSVFVVLVFMEMLLLYVRCRGWTFAFQLLAGRGFSREQL